MNKSLSHSAGSIQKGMELVLHRYQSPFPQNMEENPCVLGILESMQGYAERMEG